MAEPADKKPWTDTKPWAKKAGKPDFKPDFKKDGNRAGPGKPKGNAKHRQD
jgi:hypothetical protein